MKMQRAMIKRRDWGRISLNKFPSESKSQFPVCGREAVWFTLFKKGMKRLIPIPSEKEDSMPNVTRAGTDQDG